MVTRLLLIRHAETDAGGRKLFVGSTDVEASRDGLERLDRLADTLRAYTPEIWFSSPLQRSVQTIERLCPAEKAGLRYQVDERLREVDFGRWEMKTFAEIAGRDPDLVEQWSHYDTFIFPGGEPVADFQGRVADVLAFLRSLPAREVAVVTHGGVIRTMICLALGLDCTNYLLFDVRPGTLTVLDLFPDGGVLRGLGM